jgi:beta-galactosidase
LVNGQSLGAKDVKKNSHVAWDVKYAPGSIEARGYKDGKVAMTTKRETTGAAAKLVMTGDRKEVRGDGEDVAMFAVAVQDAQGRVVPITDNEVTFRVAGAGKLIGLGNGDPTDQQSDKGTSRKAFTGYCMAIVQSAKKSGEITVEATSPGLAPATVTIAVNEVKLRPQVAVWEREVPKGAGVTGLWRPVPQQGDELTAFLGGNGMVFLLRQEGSSLGGTVEGGNVNFTGGGDVPVPIENGKVAGESISFKAGRRTFTGTVKADRIDLEQTIEFPFKRPEPKPESPNRPAVGPAPDESDPSINWGRRRRPNSITLQRAER